MGKSLLTVIVALTEKLQKPKEILSELVVLQNLGTWEQEMRLPVPFSDDMVWLIASMSTQAVELV